MILFDIVRSSYVDGPGIRTAVFFKGCNLKCAWCHNPESQSFKQEIMFYKNKCAGCKKCVEKCAGGGINDKTKCILCGKCALYCPESARKLCGSEYTVGEVAEEIKKDIPYYKNSGGGVTFSGGECMLQPDALLELLKVCRAEGIHTAVDTAGSVPREYFEAALPFTDLFLYDIKAFSPQRHRELTGVDNRLILSNFEYLLSQNAAIWVRIPVVPGANTAELPEIARYLKDKKVEKIELLPYHAMGENKYRALGSAPTSFSVPTAEEMKEYNKLFDF